MTATEAAPAALATELTYSAHRVCELTGATYRQLDYWVRRGWLEPLRQATGSGHAPREFDFAHVEIVYYALALQRQGFIAEASLRIATRLGAGESVSIRAAHIIQLTIAIAQPNPPEEAPA